MRSDRRAYFRAYYAANREKVVAQIAAWHRANPDKVRAYKAAWQGANPASAVATRHRRRARKAGNGGSYTLTEWTEKLELFAHLCVYCGQSGRPLTIDHKIPISRGGTNSIENLVPACKSCNCRKGSKTAAEFLR